MIYGSIQEDVNWKKQKRLGSQIPTGSDKAEPSSAEGRTCYKKNKKSPEVKADERIKNERTANKSTAAAAAYTPAYWCVPERMIRLVNWVWLMRLQSCAIHHTDTLPQPGH
ncbi:hypothetical protein J6590_038530 [Homalodisca vitripennis]|nr:hypothetical protein J6590_038530 [Homalodisca vitripennis]